MTRRHFRDRDFWAGVGFLVLGAAILLAPATTSDELTPVSGQVVGTWKSWRQKGWVLATDHGDERVHVGRNAWGGETELRSAAILDGDRIAARVGRDLLGRPNGDMWGIVVNGDTVLTYRERKARQGREGRSIGIMATALGLFLVGVTLKRRQSARRAEEPPALPGQTD